MNVSEAFATAIRMVENDPSMAITYANSVLESVVKQINKKIVADYKPTETLSKQTTRLLDIIKKEEKDHIPEEIRRICKGLYNTTAAIEDLRSRKTMANGKTEDDYMLEEKMFA